MKRRILSIPRVLSLATGGTLFLYLGYLAATIGPWIDEFYTLHAISLPWLDMLLERLRRGHPPLYFVLEKLIWESTQSLLASPLLRLRLLSLTTWGLAIILFALLGRGLAAPRGRWYCVGLFAISNVAVLHAANARMYSLALLLAVVHFLSYLHLLKTTELGASRWTVLFLLSAVAGILTSPSFALLTLCLGIASLSLYGWRAAQTRYVFGALLLSALYYVPALYFYLETPAQLGPVTKHFTRLTFSAFALLTSIGRGKVPPEGTIAAFGSVASVLFSLIILRLLFLKWRECPAMLRAPTIAFAALYALIFATGVLCLVPYFSKLRVGTDRYLVVFVPLGVWITGNVIATRLSRRFGLWIFTAMVACSALTLSQVKPPENELVRQEFNDFAASAYADFPIIISPPEIEEGIRLYLPEAQFIGSIGIANNTTETRNTLLSKAIQEETCTIIYYRGHVPELLVAANRLFETSAVLSRKIYGSKRDPILAIIWYAQPRREVAPATAADGKRFP